MVLDRPPGIDTKNLALLYLGLLKSSQVPVERRQPHRSHQMIDGAGNKLAKQGKRIIMPFQHEMSQTQISLCNRIRVWVKPAMCATHFDRSLCLASPHECNGDAPIGKVWV